jgi:hypothetical protein
MDAQNEDVRIQARGARGSFRFSRLSAGEFAFRVPLAEGHTLGEAAGGALEVDPSFDPGLALLALVDDQLITSLRKSQRGDQL